MKTNSLLVCTSLLAVLGSGMAAERPRLKRPPIADPVARAQAMAESAIYYEILRKFTDPSAPRSLADQFSRAVPIQPSLYTYAMAGHAPEGVTASATRFPFEIYGQPAYAKAAPPTVMWGYYDATAKKLQLYVSAESRYVAAAEHPFIKAREGKS